MCNITREISSPNIFSLVRALTIRQAEGSEFAAGTRYLYYNTLRLQALGNYSGILVLDGSGREFLYH